LSELKQAKQMKTETNDRKKIEEDEIKKKKIDEEMKK
jgi:hypothetical protein